jgi:transcriptional regulator with XRE-family HTH domain
MTKSEDALARGKRLRILREELGLTRAQFADKLSVSEHTLKAFETGARELSAPGVREYCRRFILAGIDVSFDFLYHGNNLQYLHKQQIVIDDNLSIQNEMLYFKENNPLAIILTVPDLLMAPFYNKGDVVGGQKTVDETQFPLLNGHVCIIEAANGIQCLRRVIKSDNRKITACTLNTDSNSNLSVIEEIEAFSIAQATRHWHLSALINLHIGESTQTIKDSPAENGRNKMLSEEG